MYGKNGSESTTIIMRYYIICILLCGHNVHLRSSPHSPGTIRKNIQYERANRSPFFEMKIYSGYSAIRVGTLPIALLSVYIKYYDNATCRKRCNSRKYDFGNLPRYKLIVRTDSPPTVYILTRRG